MNKKLIAETAFGRTVYCVLSSEENYEEQLEKVFDLTPGKGLSVSLEEDRITLRDYFHGEEVSRFSILSFEDCEEDVVLAWKNVEGEN